MPRSRYINEQFVPEGSFMIVPDGSATAMWADLSKHVSIFLINMENQMDNLQDVIYFSEAYLDGYLSGNMITQKFFR